MAQHVQSLPSASKDSLAPTAEQPSDNRMFLLFVVVGVLASWALTILVVARSS